MKEKNKNAERNRKRFYMKNVQEIDNQRMKLDVKEMKKDAKKNQILFQFNELKKKNKKLRLSNCKEESRY